ncbi:MAG: competence/damage-inducible protein A [Chloroflexi bacterium]|nr:competence/damage-inducible protein A [Chloroflexota bacterium]MCL5075859.1 competence/damage-inducible protein A [Chloroflexota bacterium]
MEAEIISVGTELLLGEITDTNAPYLAQHLAGLGIDLHWISQVGDNQSRLVEVLHRAWNRSELIIITGGLGPTEDDLTREAIAELLDEPMMVEESLEQELRAYFARRGLYMSPQNIKQATLIRSAQSLPNPIGTAPGWWVERSNRRIVAMPGVPAEMKRMWEDEVLPRLRSAVGGPSGAVIVSRTLKVFGLGESTVEERIRPLLSSTNPTLATYARTDGIHLRLTAKAGDRTAAESLISPLEVKVRDILGSCIYGVDDETMATVVGRLLSERGLTLATMESCTGGLLSSMLTDVPGSSSYFKGGFVAYSEAMKVSLDVDPVLVAAHGVVSGPVAIAMAATARRQLGTSLGLSVTGVAGPDSLEGQPIGTLYIGLDGEGDVVGEHPVVKSFLLPMARPDFKRVAALHALNLLRLTLFEAGGKG